MEGNSYKEKAEASKKEIKRVSGATKIKSNPGRVLKSSLINSDVDDIKQYVIFDVLLPALKKTLWEIISNGSHMMIFGSKSSGSSSGAKQESNRVSYRSYYDTKSYEPSRVSARQNYAYNDIVFDTKYSAEECLEQMCDIIENYDVVSIAELYEIAGLDSVPTDHNYGWQNLAQARIDRDRDGWIIKFPKVVVIK